MIPAEVQAAKRFLSDRLRFGDPLQIEALKVMERWQEVECAYCTGGWVVTAAKERFVCNACQGTGKVWVRK
jgi:hypothetical protein